MPQDNFQFDPQLFGDYREPQNNVLSSGFDEWLTYEAGDADFLTSYNLPPTAPGLLPPQPEAEALPPKKNLISQIDEVNASDDGPGEQLDCNKIWYDPVNRTVDNATFTNNFIGINCAVAPAYRTKRSTWTLCALICRRKQSALAMVPWLMRRSSRVF